MPRLECTAGTANQHRLRPLDAAVDVTLKTLAIALLVILTMVAVVSVTLAYSTYRRFYSRLRDFHPATWRDLGSPTMQAAENEPADGSDAFVANRHYLKLPDPVLHALGNRLRVLPYVAVGCFISLGVLGLLAGLL